MYRQERASSLLFRLVSEFIAEHWVGASRVAVSRVEVGKGFKEAAVYIVVSPESQEKNALKELAGMRKKIYNEVAGILKTKFTPRFEFRIDKGEKNRERIEDLLKSIGRSVPHKNLAR